jgi:predicted RNA-binding protein with PUA-like domain
VQEQDGGAAVPAAIFFGATMAKTFWLMKSEPSECSIDDALAAPNATVPWTGVRNYQARNYMRDEMHVGDRAFFYHSSCPEPGIAGIVEISRVAYPDATQFDPKSAYYDAKSTPEAPRWVNVDVKLVRKTPLVSVPTLRETRGLEDMVTLRRGNRLSITPVTPAEWKIIEKLISGSKQ